jgi:hypothetical protein
MCIQDYVYCRLCVLQQWVQHSGVDLGQRRHFLRQPVAAKPVRFEDEIGCKLRAKLGRGRVQSEYAVGEGTERLVDVAALSSVWAREGGGRGRLL